MQLVHLASRLYGTPLLIARPKLDVILSVLGSRIGLPDLDMAMPLSVPRQIAAVSPAGIAVIPVVGTLVKRSMGIEAASNLTLNIMSLGGIALSVGMLIDNSVVILGAIARKRDAGLAPV